MNYDIEDPKLEKAYKDFDWHNFKIAKECPAK